MSNFAQDMAVKQAWGIPLDKWIRLTPGDRKYYREHVTEAPHFNQENP